MAIILALDTSTEACSCALNLHGEIYEDYAVIPRQHAQNILPMVQNLLHQKSLAFSDLDAIAFGRGPGSFTGLRIAAGVTQGIAFAANLPVIPISTLAALALQAYEELGSSRIVACLDARIDEVYWASFLIDPDTDTLSLLGDEYLCKPELMQTSELQSTSNVYTVIGNGLSYKARFPQALIKLMGTQLPEQLPRAASIARLAARELANKHTIAAEQVHPLYLRDKVTHN